MNYYRNRNSTRLESTVFKKTVVGTTAEQAEVDLTNATYIRLNRVKVDAEKQFPLLDERLATVAARIEETQLQLTVADSPETYQAVALALNAALSEREAISGTIKNLRAKFSALEQEESAARSAFRHAQSCLAAAKGRAILTPDLLEKVSEAYSLLIEGNAIDRYAPLPDWLRATHAVTKKVSAPSEPERERGPAMHGPIMEWTGYGAAPTI